MKYTLEHFIKKFEAIPEENWCTDTIDNKRGGHCVLGHCGGYEGEESMDLWEIEPYIVAINDNRGDYNKYGKTPKERVLNRLRELQEEEEGNDVVEEVNKILEEEVCSTF